ncbi:peptidase domain-containing ABC transporter [Novispirillum sp. DQ9]|uniref:peptidase domain-containing ABC transporter n=1 Tax=Novispirillum sp. DQ9 TaxID=3398612 RepID=UPI003C79BD5A
MIHAAPPVFSTALRSLVLLARHHGLDVKAEHAEGLNPNSGVEPPITDILRVANAAGLKGKALTGRDWAALQTMVPAFPALAVTRDGGAVIVVNVVRENPDDPEPGVAVLDPKAEDQGVTLWPKERFLEAWGGTLVVLKRRLRLSTDDNQPFGLMWFAGEILRHKKFLRDIALAAIMLQIVSLATPMMFQIIIDKVIPHHSFQTLYVVAGAYIMVTVFEGIFSFLRQYLLLFTSNRIDSRLASRTFSHLLSLPMPFFERAPAGVLIKHMQQTEKIREFLTGRLFLTLLDAAALPLLIVVLLLYSVKLTLVVLGFSAVITAVIWALVPTFKRRLRDLYTAEGARQAHLVETIHGMRTVKAAAGENEQMLSWNTKVAQAVDRHFQVGRISATGNTITSVLEKLMLIAVIGLGAVDVFNGAMTIGALVAFQMFCTRVSGPLVQIVGLIHEYQETALSVAMLGEVMNTPPERAAQAGGVRPNLMGRVAFEGVGFTYPGAANPALDNVSFKVEPGQVLGIVGRSGSGKTTLTRMIQGMAFPAGGLVRLDGIDIRQIDLGHLRRSIGVVLQDNFLFRGTIRDNICLARPDAPMAEVLEVARLAGAAEFIERLPAAYDTMVEENGSNFSGGQKQRIAIARALLGQPRLLIFDEATSALDPESEAIIQDNLAQIARGRTLIIVSHRLTSLVGADAVMVLDQGKVIDVGHHRDLLGRCGLYRHLWQQQTRQEA